MQGIFLVIFKINRKSIKRLVMIIVYKMIGEVLTEQFKKIMEHQIDEV